MRYLLLLLASLCAAAPASAATLTLATTGSDANNGITAPLATLQAAANRLSDGDTLLIQAGTYTAGAYFDQRNLTIRGVGDVTLDGSASSASSGVKIDATSGVTVENLKVYRCKVYGIMVTDSSNITIRNCDCSYNLKSGILTGNTSDLWVTNNITAYNVAEHGIYLSQSGDRLHVNGNQVFNNGGAGLQINAVQDVPDATDPNQDSISNNCEVVGNTVHDNSARGGAALNLMGVCNSLIANNLIYNDNTAGIALWDDGAGPAYSCKNNQIYNNTLMFAAGKGNYGVQFAAGSTGNQVVNNILCVFNGPAIDTEEALQSNCNLFGTNNVGNGASLTSWRNGTGNDQNSRVADPKLGADYHPLTGSPAIDGGENVCPSDLAGVLRPQGANSDIGCFELVAGGTTPPPPAETYSIAGFVKLSGKGLAAVTVKAGTAATTTAADGSFSFAGLSAGSYTVSGSLSGYTMSAAQTITVGPSQTNVTFTATAVVATPPPAPSSVVIYSDSLNGSWNATASKASYSLSATTPVKEGKDSIALAITGTDGYLLLSGKALDVTGKSTLKFWVNGGTTGRQALRVRAYVKGVQQPSLNLQSYGMPVANGWIEYQVPLTALKVSGATFTGLKFTAGTAQKQCFIDYIRVE